MLKVESIEAGYGPMQVLWKPSLEVKKGSISAGFYRALGWEDFL
jgi:ABC-type branched-subunit amino acid transport system ATPase component